MNKTVTVDGMEVKTKVGSNLLIAPDTITASDDNEDSKYVTAITQVRKCLLEPSSTINGVNYWYTVEASADGNKLDGKNWIAYNENADPSVANATAGKANYDSAFNAAYTLGSTFTSSTIGMTDQQLGAGYGYVDYIFYLKATSDAANQKVVMTKCNLLHNGAAIGMDDQATPAAINDKAWRVAMFSEQATANTDITTAVADTSLVSILRLDGATNQTPGEAVTGATTTASVTNANAKAVVGNISTAGATAYYKVTVRLWLEGEDTTCTSETYAKLTNKYTLDLEFKLENDDTNAVQLIGSALPSNS